MRSTDWSGLWAAASIEDVDPEVASCLQQEIKRQRNRIELVASENFTWLSAISVMASAAANKLSDGYPGRRATPGCENIDQLEQLAIDRAREIFGAEHANVQPASGAQANMAVYFACLRPGDTFLAMRPEHGGHHTHGSDFNFSGRFYSACNYGVDRRSGRIDFGEVMAQAESCRPKLIVCGGSAYPRVIDVERFREIADHVGALLLCDMAHFAGLVAAGLHPNPVPLADFVTSTVHKTLAGPRCGGFVLCRREYADAIDQAVSPGTQSAPLPQLIAAKAVCFGLARTEAFRSYQRQVRANAVALASALASRGVGLLTGGTDTHMIMIELSPDQPGAKEAVRTLSEIGITASQYAIPHDARLPSDSSGIRLGTPAVTIRGFDEAACAEVGAIIAEALSGAPDVGQLRDRVASLCGRHPLYPGWRGY
jgi:glycine hydroxymethyltransferase